jgi:hypothetical protein
MIISYPEHSIGRRHALFEREGTPAAETSHN